MSKLGNEHWTTIKRNFRYLCGTVDYAICYQGRHEIEKILDAHGFFDTDLVEIFIIEYIQVVMCLMY